MIVKGNFPMPEKENVSRLRAADFARICGTNKRTLHHYDQIGLFAPRPPGGRTATAITARSSTTCSWSSPP